jgi:hypothetical protein
VVDSGEGSQPFGFVVDLTVGEPRLPAVEAESNDSAATASPLDGAGPWYVDAELATGDADWYVVPVPAGASLTTQAAGAQGDCAEDIVMELYADGSSIAAGGDDDDGPGLCPRIDGTHDAFAAGLAAGRWRLKVRPFSSSTRSSIYRLYVRIDL